MTLGTNIQRLRKEHNMSQGDLADALDISRQSVSKWETDTATPDLDKLLKLSEIFGISLDELVKGEDVSVHTPTESFDSSLSSNLQEPIPVTIRTGLETRQVAGIILLCMAFLVVLVCTIMGGFLAGLIFCIPFFICGLICMFVKKHTGIYCGWAVNIMLIIYLHLATGSSYAMVFNPYVYVYANPIAILVGWMHLIFIITLMYITIKRFRHIPVNWNKRKEVALLSLWILYLVLHFPYTKVFVDITIGIMKSLVYVYIILSIARIILLTALIICTLNWYKWRKSKQIN